MNEDFSQIPEGKTKVLFAEGTDDKLFFIELLKNLSIKDIHILNFEGIDNLTNFFEQTIGFNLTSWKKVTSILIARDSEKSSKSAIASITDSLKKKELIDSGLTDVPTFEFLEHKGRKIGIVLFPGLDEDGKLCDSGTLEDLCIKIFKEKDAAKEADKRIKDFQEKHRVSFSRIHKTKLHGAFSFTDKYVGCKLAEVMKAGGYDIDSPCLLPVIEMIRGL
jgi:hypothetical protein